MNPWIDVTRPVHEALPVWPGDPPVVVEGVRSIERDGYAVHRLEMGTHCGTHMDAPSHFLAGAAGVDRLPLDALVGRCRVVGSDVAVAGRRVLYRTGRPLSVDTARRLVRHGVRLVGVDSSSVDDADGDFPVHHVLLGAGVVIVEGLDLSRVSEGAYQLIALPLRLEGLDGSPCRVLLRALGGGRRRRP
ncbi:MAG TPA: cyclase family protein [Candidatus Xenobia bacterium]